jgi:catalase-peroxidase
MRKSVSRLLIACAVSAALPLTLALAAAPSGAPQSAQFWWPDHLDLSPLRQHDARSNPLGADFDYPKAFATLNLQALKADIRKTLTTSQDWWPADYGNYGPFFIRMAWHGAGTYRVFDGRGGADGADQRFEPLNSWPDNVSLDKARRLLWPIKQKYGQSISWGDLMVLTGNVALESMGFQTFGFAAGRTDDWEPDLVYWGPELKWLGDERHTGDRQLQKPLGATQMGLIYVNPEGPNGNPDPLAAAKDIREAFGRMAMNDEETVALIAGGHTFGKAHGAHDPSKCVGPEPAAAGLEQQGLGWVNKCGKGNGSDTVSSGLEGSWSVNPTLFTTQYLDNLFKYDWVKTKSPAGATQWIPSDPTAASLTPDAQDATVRHAPIMFTTDLAVKFDPAYRKVALRFHDHPQEFKLAFAKAWFKLTHRDMGPRSRYLGPDAPQVDLIWQDPLPKSATPLVTDSDVAELKSKILGSGLTVPELVRTAWASAATFRGTDYRGGPNGARIRLAPQKDWPVNDPRELAIVLKRLESIRGDFNRSQSGGKQISLADIIVLGGDAAVEKAAQDGGHPVHVAFTPGRVDASQEQTDPKSFAVLEPTSDAFRNYFVPTGQTRSPAELMIDRANMLTLSVPEMVALVGGLRALNANAAASTNGVFTTRPGTLSNDFFINLLDMSTKWDKSTQTDGLYEGHDRKTGKLRWTATPVDLVFGSNSELRAVSEVYASSDGQERFVGQFVEAWTKVMSLDRFDLH